MLEVCFWGFCLGSFGSICRLVCLAIIDRASQLVCHSCIWCCFVGVRCLFGGFFGGLVASCGFEILVVCLQRLGLLVPLCFGLLIV
jgi:hypothetical protein